MEFGISNPDTRKKYIGSAGINNNLLPVSGEIGYKPHLAQVRGCLHQQAMTCNTIQTAFFFFTKYERCHKFWQKANLPNLCFAETIQSFLNKQFIQNSVACITDFPNIALSHAHPINYLLKFCNNSFLG